MASSSANDIIDRALTKARVFHPGESVPSRIQSQVWDELNDMLERWALEKRMVYAEVLENFSMVVGQKEYTYGDGGDFNSDRPDFIEDSTFIRSGTTDYPVKLQNLDIYRRKVEKATRSRPRFLSFNPEFPMATIFLWPTPSTADNIYFRVRKQLVKFADRTTSVSLPVGFRGGIVSNLAVDISGNFGKKVSAETAVQAGKFVKAIKMSNRIKSKGMKTDLLAMTRGTTSPSIISGPFI